MYKITRTTSIIRLSDGAIIPAAEGNRDYAEYQLWVRSGNTPEPADPVIPVPPSTVTMRQARLAVLQSGLLATVNAAVANMPGAEGEAARIEWEFSATVERDRPLVQSLTAALGLTDAQLDDLFMLAATL
ncbi:MAG: hypothetical protein A2Z95_06285 [Gallionellales bacterium GWA2_60_18]|nr:MAG: hypothetical protein A2Z95_06285 [Gallionellales bacterium GWA2_60_18]